jgi:hypothetical protein
MERINCRNFLKITLEWVHSIANGQSKPGLGRRGAHPLILHCLPNSAMIEQDNLNNRHLTQ